MKIGPVIRDTKTSNRYCGPAVISSLTGADTKETAAVLRHVSGKTSIMGTSWRQVLDALALYGIETVLNERNQKFTYAYDRELGKRPTLTQWLKKTERPAGVVYLVASGCHWQLVSGRRYVCGISKEVVSIKDKVVKRRARVEAHAQLVAVRKIGLCPEVKAKLAERKVSSNSTNSIRAKAMNLIRDHGLDWEQERAASSPEGFSGWLYPNPAWKLDEDTDPLEGDHFCTSWIETYEKAMTYAEMEYQDRLPS